MILCLDGGTFWIKNDEFSQSTKRRYFGSLGLLVEYKINHWFSIFATPDYLGYYYKLKNTGSDGKSYIHNFNAAIGLALKF